MKPVHGPRARCVQKLALAVPAVSGRRSVVDEHRIELNAFGEIYGNDHYPFLEAGRLLRNKLERHASLRSQRIISLPAFGRSLSNDGDGSKAFGPKRRDIFL